MHPRYISQNITNRQATRYVAGACSNLSNSNTSELRVINNIFLQESIESIIIDNESSSFGNEDFTLDKTGSGKLPVTCRPSAATVFTHV